MAKYLGAEYCKEVVEDSLRIHGGYRHSTEHEIERLYRDAPMLLIGEGSAEIQKMITGRALVRDYGRLFRQAATLTAVRKSPDSCRLVNIHGSSHIR